MILEIDAFWLTMAFATVCILSFIFALGLNAVIGRDGFGAYGTMVIIVAGFFGTIVGANYLGYRMIDIQMAVMYGLGGAFVLLLALLLAKAIANRA